jgi:adenosylcobyric acid synthase
MVLGTASHVGKSIIAAALCRIFADDGYRVAPFKAQNMSLNSAATPCGHEIGRAQALQAEACRIAARPEMNPILLKPSGDTSSQVVLLGRAWGQLSAAHYHLQRVHDLFPVVCESYRKLAEAHDLIVLEGAGSPAEINLKASDIVNLRMARAANAACLLLGDIDRGGVFASLLGTLELLEPDERALIKGFAINKFRGDPDLLRPGVEMMEERIGLPCVGVIPFLHSLGLDEEDSVALEDRPCVGIWHDGDQSPARRLRLGVVAFPHLANFTDFDTLRAEPSATVAFLARPEDVAAADWIILPGSKQTIDDLEWLSRTGLREAILRFRGPTTAICGGMQMLGRAIHDPMGTENSGEPRSARGLGLLGIATTLASEKVTRRISGCASGQGFHGYEIHLGETTYESAEPFATIIREGAGMATPDGAVSADGRVIGSYVHGLFDDDAFRHTFLNDVRVRCGLAPATNLAFPTAEREARIDRLATHVRQSLDMRLLCSWIEARE